MLHLQRRQKCIVTGYQRPVDDMLLACEGLVLVLPLEHLVSLFVCEGYGQLFRPEAGSELATCGFLRLLIRSGEVPRVWSIFW